MSKKKLNEIIRKWTGPVLLTVLPTVLSLRSTEMDFWSVIIIGGGVLWAWIAIVLSEWKGRWVRAATKNTVIRCAGGALIAFFTGWIAHSVYEPPLTDPEAKANKYVRMTRIPSPDAQFEYATLIEFGVNRLNSEGFVVGVQPSPKPFEHWYGIPGRTDVQSNVSIYESATEEPNNILWIWVADFAISPRRSYYLCIMDHASERCEPKDIMYFAVASNQKALLPAKKIAVGHQYQKLD
jgi:hypothetical protein